MFLRFSFFISCMASSLVLGRSLFTLKNCLKSYVSCCRRQNARNRLARGCSSDCQVTSVAFSHFLTAMSAGAVRAEGGNAVIKASSTSLPPFLTHVSDVASETNDASEANDTESESTAGADVDVDGIAAAVDVDGIEPSSTTTTLGLAGAGPENYIHGLANSWPYAHP